MIFHETTLPGAYLIDLELFEDERGYNARTWCESEFEEAGLTGPPRQANTMLNHDGGTLRGMHFQLPPKTEAKLFRVTRGSIHDIIIDLRPGSETYGGWLSVRLSADVPRMLYVPENFAQGYQTLEDRSEISYQTTAFFTPELQTGLRWDDPAFELDWPLEPTVMKDADREWPDFKPERPLVRIGGPFEPGQVRA